MAQLADLCVEQAYLVTKRVVARDEDEDIAGICRDAAAAGRMIDAAVLEIEKERYASVRIWLNIVLWTVSRAAR